MLLALGLVVGATLAADVAVQSRAQPLLGDASLEAVELTGEIAGVPLTRPVGRALVDGSRDRVAFVDVIPVPPLVSDEVRIDEREAVALVTASELAGSRGATAARLVAHPGETFTRLKWWVDPPLDLDNLTNPVFLVDAQTGTVAKLYDKVDHAEARAFSPNPVVDPDGTQSELHFIDEAAQVLSGPYYHAFNCVDPGGGMLCAPANRAEPDAQGNFIYPLPDISKVEDNVALEDEFSEVSAYYHADVFQRYLLDLGLPGMRCHAEGQRAVIVANYHGFFSGGWLAVPNAAYTDDCSRTLILGQGVKADWAYDGDVIYHEITHGLVAHLMGAGRKLAFERRRPDAAVLDAGAINEGFADFLASAFTGDSLHGEYVFEVGLGSGRDLDNDFRCPQSLTGQIHDDGEVFASALWDAYELFGDAFVPVTIDTIRMLRQNSSFEDAALALDAVATAELGADAAATIRDVLAERGLDDCPRYVAYDDIDRALMIVPRSWYGRYRPVRPPPYQLYFDVPVDLEPGVDTMVVSYDQIIHNPDGWAELTDLHVSFRYGEPLEFAYTDLGEEDGIQVDVVVEPDGQTPHADDATFAIPIVPGERVYAAIFNVSPHVTVLSDFEITFEASEPLGSSSSGDSDGTGDPPADDDALDDDGCGCRAAAHDRGGQAAWGLFMLALIRSRSRRRAPSRRSVG